ncbi:wax ester/triacylglycerol synthase family O-acyltransferase [Wenzhouxiangella sp. XN24]|uniref:wax ester/triacylglycerol synthase family O-acyltransferase n=1 Tax=Wenzhouxiangella sp. XN24 TaxID=2713569 RepID=UPI0013ED1B19|nr:wax ester/triacylglycerol synthase family O-acyltransferase [Wenzhouxiangella sp. XN24]NGX16621.1 wax ester/triacylglycerol synthase family O-acyltransferase [Wenzhouxiangella sp. XN24]
MTRISITDYAFLLTETADSPRHVGSLQIFRPPEGYAGDFVGDLIETLRRHKVGKPFNQRLKVSLTGMAQWVPDRNFDLDYHVRRSALPAPGSRRQLADLASRLHAFMLDREHPLWELHFVEGLDDGCFAIYTKIHHAYCDGATLVRLANASLSEDPNDPEVRAFWQMTGGAGEHPERDIRAALSGIGGGVKAALVMSKELSGIAGKMALDRLGMRKSALEVPFTAPRTALNGHITRARRIAGGSLEIERLKAAARLTGTTLNDVIVTLCDISLRRYLARYAELPRSPLVAQLPVNLRRQGENSSTNILGIIPVRLAGVSRNPLKRLREVHRSTTEMKDALFALSRETVMAYTLLIQGAAVVGDILHVSGLMPPAGNILISNLPGSPVKLYLRGARLEEIFPISTIPPDMVMNITVFSYAGKMFFGMIAGYEAMPHLPEMRTYMYEALEALEHEIEALLEGSPADDAAAAAGPAGAIAGKGQPGSTTAAPTPRRSPARRKTRSKTPARKPPAAKKPAARTAPPAQKSPARAMPAAKKPAKRKAAAKKKPSPAQ